MYDTAHARIEGDTDLVVIRDFKANAKDLFRALTDPEILPRWQAGPPGWTLTIDQMDWQIGAPYRWTFTEDATGSWFAFEGEVLAYDPTDRIAMTQRFDPGTFGGDMGGQSEIDQRIESIEGGVRLTITMRFANAADREAAMATGMTDGMEMSYAALDKVLST